MKKIFENAVWWSGVVMVGLILGVSLQFVRAWTEPTDAPPGGNIGAPINTSAIYQIKAGILGVVGLVANSFQMPTGAGAGKVLTSDAAGTGSWQAGGGISCTTVSVEGQYPIATCPSGYTVIAGGGHCDDGNYYIQESDISGNGWRTGCASGGYQGSGNAFAVCCK